MLNVISSENISITPMNYYLTFAASDSESELEMAVRVNQKQGAKILDVLLLGYAAQYHIDLPVELPIEITRHMDAGDGVNSISENINSKLVWLGMADDHVTISVAGYAHAIRVHHQLMVEKLKNLNKKLTNQSQQMSVENKPVANVGIVTVFAQQQRRVVRYQDMMLVAGYSRGRNDARLENQPMTLYVQDVEGLWLYASIRSSQRYIDFVDNVRYLPL